MLHSAVSGGNISAPPHDHQSPDCLIVLSSPSNSVTSLYSVSSDSNSLASVAHNDDNDVTLPISPLDVATVSSITLPANCVPPHYDYNDSASADCEHDTNTLEDCYSRHEAARHSGNQVQFGNETQNNEFIQQLDRGFFSSETEQQAAIDDVSCCHQLT